MRSVPLHAAILILVALSSLGARHDFTVEDGYAAMAGRSAFARCIVQIESRFDPNAVGHLGELGLVQLAPFGKLPEFYALGYSDPFDPWQSADYLDWALANGQAHHWAASWYC